jgi:uncharacterized protein
MPRPRKCRRVEAHPTVTLFKPQGIPARDLEEIILSVEGLEALRLVDLEGLDQETAAERMNVSRPTLNRVLGTARRLVSRALVHGMAIRVHGGDFVLGAGLSTGPGGGRGGWRGGRGGGRRGPGRPG